MGTRAFRSTSLILPLALAVLVTGCSGTGGQRVEPADPSKMTPEAAVAGLSALVSDMNRILSRTFGALQQARGEKDEATVRCLENKTALMRGLIELANSAEITIREAALLEDTEQVRSEYVKVSLAHAKLRQLQLAAGACPSELEVLPAPWPAGNEESAAPGR